MRLLRALLPKGSLGRGLALLVGGTALGQIITVLASPLLTRLYTPEDFGLLAIFAALLGIIGAMVCLRYELALLLAEDDGTVASLLALSFAVALAVSLLAALAVWAFGDTVALWVNAPEIRPFLWLLPVGLLAVGLYTALQYWATRRKAFGRIARTRLSQSLSQALTQVGFGVLALGPVGLLVGQILGQSAGVVTLAVALRREYRRLPGAVSFGALRRAAVRYRRFPTFATGAALLNSASRLLPALLVAAIYGPQVAGLFALAQRVMGTPMRLLGNAVAQVYLSEAPRLARDDSGAMYALFMSTTRRLLGVGLLCLGVVALAGPQLFALVFGAVWIETGRFAQLLTLMYLAQLVVSPTSQTLVVLERQDLQLAWDALRLAVLGVVFLAAYALQWPPLTTIAVFGIGMTACYLILFALARLVLVAHAQARI